MNIIFLFMLKCKLTSCYEEIIGRTDKEFCCDTHRSAYNNAQNKKLFGGMNKRINNTKSTYKCLQALYPLSKGIHPMGIDTMYENNFKRDCYYTYNFDPKNPESKWICIEDYGYRQISKTEFLINKTETHDRTRSKQNQPNKHE